MIHLGAASCAPEGWRPCSASPLRPSRSPQPNQHYVEITIPQGISYEVFSPPTLPGWDNIPATVSKTFGERWCLEKRSAILLVPSVVARRDNNILINPAHSEFRKITASLHQPVFWDRRLFGA